MKKKTKNAADESQVRKDSEKEDVQRKNELADIKKVLKTDHGRRVMWRLLEKCKTFGSIWSPSAAIHFNAGQQDIGHFIMAEIVDADEELLFKMMKENKQKQKELEGDK